MPTRLLDRILLALALIVAGHALMLLFQGEFFRAACASVLFSVLLVRGCSGGWMMVRPRNASKAK